MPGLIRNLRARSFDAFGWAAVLLAAGGMAAVGLENVSFGHEHLDGGHGLHHHHVYLGSHEHPDEHGHHHDAPAPQDHGGHDQDHDQGHDPEAPAPQDHPASQGTVTVSAAPALFQPAAAGGLAAPLVDAAPLEPALALPPAARPVLQPAPPRGPPLSSAAPGVPN